MSSRGFALSNLLLCVSCLLGPVNVNAGEPVKISLDGEVFYLHDIWHQNASEGNTLLKSVGDVPHSVVEKNNVIYVADNSNGESYSVKRFNAFSGEQLSDMIITLDVSTYKYSLFSSHQNFYLVQDDAGSIIIVFDVIDNSNNEVKLYWSKLDISNPVITDLDSYYSSVKISANWACVGLPCFTGDVNAGSFSAYFPLSYDDNKDFLHDPVYKTRVYYYKYSGGSETENRFSDWCEPDGFWDNPVETDRRSMISMLNDEIYVIDNTLNPMSLRAINYPVSISTTDQWTDHNANACGFKSFEFLGHRFVIYGMTGNPEYNYMLGTWDCVIPETYDRNSGFDLSGISGRTVLSGVADGSQQYRGSAASWNLSTVAIYPQTVNGPVAALHIYVPGQSLKTYQLSRVNRVTGIGNVEDNIIPENSFRIEGRVVRFDDTVRTLRIYSMSGLKVCCNDNLSEIDLSELPAGVYIMDYDGSISKMQLR